MYGKKIMAAFVAALLAVAPCAVWADVQETSVSCEEEAAQTTAYEQETVSLQAKYYDSQVTVSDTVKTYSLAKDGETYLSANFQVKEFASHDGADTVCIDSELVTLLQKIRDHFGVPVVIESGYRTETHNAAVGGVTNSYHTRGMAADIQVEGYTTLQVAQYAQTIGVHGIGYYDTWVHVETRTSGTYYWDGDGNEVESFLDIEETDKTAPVISNVKVYGVTTDGYWVSCTVTDDESGVSRVQFPTWTVANGQDDLAGSWSTSSSVSGTINGTQVTFYVSKKSHRWEAGAYNTHIYAYDKAGNYAAYAVPQVTLAAYGYAADAGDTNGDGKVDAADALFVLQGTVGLRTLTGEQIARADIDGSGDASVLDALYILQVTTSLIVLQ